MGKETRNQLTGLEDSVQWTSGLHSYRTVPKPLVHYISSLEGGAWLGVHAGTNSMVSGLNQGFTKGQFSHQRIWFTLVFFFKSNNCFEQKQKFEKKNMYQFIDLRQNGRTKPTDKNYRMNKTMFQFELSGPIPDKLSSTNHTAHWRPTRIWQWHNSIDFSCILHRKIFSDSSGTHFPLISVRIMIDYPLPPFPSTCYSGPSSSPIDSPIPRPFFIFQIFKGITSSDLQGTFLFMSDPS